MKLKFLPQKKEKEKEKSINLSPPVESHDSLNPPPTPPTLILSFSFPE